MMQTENASVPSRDIASINPADGRLLRQFQSHSEQEVEHKLQSAIDTFQRHRRMPLAERARLMIRVAEILELEKHNHARTTTQEMGKLFRAAVQEVKI